MDNEKADGSASLDWKGADEKTESSSRESLDIHLGDEVLQPIDAENVVNFSEEYNLKPKRELDLFIPLVCAAVYFAQFLDKTSSNYASTIISYRWHSTSVCKTTLKICGRTFQNPCSGFLIWEFPTTYIAQKLRTAKYLGTNIVLWGIILMLHSVALIISESMFYKKNEQASRISWFYVMVTVPSTLPSKMVSSGVSFYDSHKIASWKIVYILLGGGLAIVTGSCVLIWLPDSPVRVTFLFPGERIAALERVCDDQRGTENKVLKREQVKDALLDIHTWLIVLTTLLASIPNGGLSNFSNLIVKSFGYTTKQMLILSMPRRAVAAVTTLLCGLYLDRKNERMVPIIFALIPTILGAGLLVVFNHSGKKGMLLFAIYFSDTFGSSLSTVYAYNVSNTSGHTKGDWSDEDIQRKRNKHAFADLTDKELVSHCSNLACA
ncbi:Thiamine pathway transporter THI73 [Leucoagaricus sp. SymC.cos]|nr:Thiamine pathway transporter THI73 [Leucoagaricus sp. SymC.cos]